MKRTKGLRRKGGRLFPQSPEDKAYWDWFIKNRQPCDVCTDFPASAAHLTKRGSGGRDRNNLVWLCEGHGDRDLYTWLQGCHPRQEGRTDAFMQEVNRDLWAVADRHTRQFDTRNYTDDDFPDTGCKECGAEFDTMRGLHIHEHHVHQHPETIGLIVVSDHDDTG